MKIAFELDDLKKIMRDCAMMGAQEAINRHAASNSLLSRKEAAKYLGISVEKFDYIKSEISATYPGKTAKYSKSSLDKYREKRTVKRAA